MVTAVVVGSSQIRMSATHSLVAQRLEALAEEGLKPAFEAVVQTVDEAVINALIANETIVGCDGHRVPALPHDELRELLECYGRLQEVCDDG